MPVSDLPLEPWKRQVIVAKPLPGTAAGFVTDADEIKIATDRVVTARVLTNIANNIREGKMPPLIEIKGLGTAIAGIKSDIAGVRAIAAEINVEAPALKAELADVRDQIKQHRADLRFEAETLGNGSGTISGDGKLSSETAKS